jgi:hypothetical protein
MARNSAENTWQQQIDAGAAARRSRPARRSAALPGLCAGRPVGGPPHQPHGAALRAGRDAAVAPLATTVRSQERVHLTANV